MGLKYKNFIAGRASLGHKNPETELDNLETAVNEWLTQNKGIEIVQMAQSPTVMSTIGERKWSYEVMVSILYREPDKGHIKE